MIQQTNPNRRTFYLTVIYGLGGLMSAALAIPGAVYLLFPPRVKKSGDWVEAGDVSQLKDQEPSELVFKRTRLDGWRTLTEKTSAWVVKGGGQQITAFAPQCTHLGCAYHWDAGNKDFLCPCHTSVFSMDGKVVSGPAPRPLDEYEVKVQGTKILIGSIKKAPIVS